MSQLKADPAKLNAMLPNVACIEGPVFRNLTPAQADLVLERVQVMARSSPDDKYLMVTRLNGHGLPANQKEWETLHPGRNYESEKDMFLPCINFAQPPRSLGSFVRPLRIV